MNQVMLVGRVLQSPVYVTTEKSAADLTKFTLVTERDSISASTIKTDHHDCYAWGPAGLQLHEHLSAGCRLAVRGSIEYQEYIDQSGNHRRVPEIRVSQFTFLDGRL